MRRKYSTVKTIIEIISKTLKIFEYWRERLLTVPSVTAITLSNIKDIIKISNILLAKSPEDATSNISYIRFFNSHILSL